MRDPGRGVLKNKEKYVKMRKILIALLCFLLAGCAGTVAPDGAEGMPKRAGNVAAEAALTYGEAPISREGSFYAGRTVIFQDGAYTAFGDGIYYVEDGAAALMIPDEIAYDVSICTDGRTLFYVNASGELREVTLVSGNSRAVTDAPIYPFGSSVVGAGQEVVYVEMPESEAREDGVPARAASVAAVSRQTGEVLESWENFYGLGCADSFTGIYAMGYDVSPRRLLVFHDGDATQADGVVTDEPYAWGGAAEGGAFWYSVANAEDDDSACTLYRVSADGTQGALTFDSEGGDCYGFTVGGFLASVHYSPPDGDFLTAYYDLRTGERIPEKRLNPAEGDINYWSGGCTLDGVDYLTSPTRICRMTDGTPVDVFDMPSTLWLDDVKLCGGWILADCMEGEFYAFPLKSDGVHPIPIYADVSALEREDGKNGATVTGCYPRLSPANVYQWERLNDALTEYHTEAGQTAERDAEECLNQASELVENGFVERDAPFSTAIRAYIQRADTLAFCFTEHRTMDNRVNRQALDIKTGYNFDTVDGHALTLQEVVTDLEGLKFALVSSAGEDNAEAMNAFLNDALSSGPSSPAFSWTLGYEGVSFYFNGQVNYPDAPQSVKYYIPFSAYPELFNAKYFAVPDNYAYDILLDDYFAEEYQMEYYGGAETVLPYLSGEGVPDSFHVSVNGDDVSVPLADYPAYATVIHKCDEAADASEPRTGGSNFLILQICGDGMTLDIFTLDDQLREFYDFGEGALPQHLPSDAYGVSHEWLGNPQQFAVLHFELADESYSKRRLYRLDYGIPELLDLSGSSLAMG